VGDDPRSGRGVPQGAAQAPPGRRLWRDRKRGGRGRGLRVLYGAPTTMPDERDAHQLIQPMLSRFEELGLDDIAQRLRALTIGPSGYPLAPDDASVLSLSSAAALLGLRSPHTVLDLVRLGRLDALDRDGEIVVARASAEAYLDSPDLAQRRVVESQLWAALDFLA